MERNCLTLLRVNEQGVPSRLLLHSLVTLDDSSSGKLPRVTNFVSIAAGKTHRSGKSISCRQIVDGKCPARDQREKKGEREEGREEMHDDVVNCLWCVL